MENVPFAEKFNRLYEEKIDRLKTDFEQKNKKMKAYAEELDRLYAMVEETVRDTPIEIEYGEVVLEVKKSMGESSEKPVKKLVLSLDEIYVSFEPRGIDYQTGSASLCIEHNNERERPTSVSIFLRRTDPELPEDEEPEYSWQIKIGYRNFRPFDRALLEGLLETIFLS